MQLTKPANLFLVLAGLSILSAQTAIADVLSPSIKERQGKKYSIEKPRSSYYGSGQAGRMTEASELRIEVAGMLDDGEFLAAIPKAKKAVQLDPGYPEGHILLARALTSKFYQQKGVVDEKLLAECLNEWQLIRYHDADLSEQMEAGSQAKRLLKIAKMLEKDRKQKLKIKEKQAEEALLAKKEKDKAQPDAQGDPENTNSTAEDDSKLASKDDASKEEVKDNATTSVKAQLAARKKRFGFF